jgi:MbtH protein
MILKICLLVSLVLLLSFARGLFAKGQQTPDSASPSLGWDEASDDLFIGMDPETKDLLLEDWRWKVGPDAKVFRVDIFGDIFTQGPNGHIYWLDTGRGSYVEVAESAEQWVGAAKAHREEWFHWKVLQELRSFDAKLKDGFVYSWRHSPMLGGAEAVDNVDFAPLQVHVSFAARVAQAVKDIPPGQKIENLNLGFIDGAGQKATGAGDEKSVLYNVVINEELQYSMWPAGEKVPEGWKLAGKTGTKQECLDYIKQVWTDMRPLSLRKKPPGGS